MSILGMVVLVAFDPVAYRRQYYLDHKEKELAYSTKLNRFRRTGVTEDQYNTQLTKQNNVCAICDKGCTKALAADHDHNSGIFRGLLCNSCNRGLGYFKDSSELLQKATQYLNNYKKEYNGS